VIERLRVENFLALRNVTVEFEPFTVLVGANASGKSTVMEALHRVCTLRYGNPRVLVEGGDYKKVLDSNSPFVSPVEVMNKSGVSEIMFCVSIDRTDVVGYGLGMSYEEKAYENSTWVFKTPPSDQFFEYDVRNIAYIKSDIGFQSALPLFPASIFLKPEFSSLSMPSFSPLPKPFIERSGAGLATVCSNLQQENPDAFEIVQASLRKVIPSIKRFRLRRAEATAQNYVNALAPANWTGIAEELIFYFEDGKGISAKYVSEGTLLVLCILVAAAGFENDGLILIDDIERGLHPQAIWELMKALRELQQQNPKLQLVATSHSPYVLNELDPKEVRLMARDSEHGATVAKLTDHPDFAEWSMVMRPGEFWTHVGETWMLKNNV
jgi:predicted ATPase